MKSSNKKQSDISIVIVTYNRNTLLKNLIQSIALQSLKPTAVYIIDNHGEAERFCEEFRIILGTIHLEYHKMFQNIGGSGGFYFGVKKAYEDKKEWIWMMDDDVELLPDATRHVERWQKRFRCFIGRRLTNDNKAFCFQPRFNHFLGVTLPIVRDVFKNSDFFRTNVGCFEGMVIHRSIVEKVGFPDARFFITWDDAIYGWLISKHTELALVKDFTLKRQRKFQETVLFGRHYSKMSDLSRFYLIKNRGLVAEYFKKYNQYSPIGFKLGTTYLFAKEIFRTLVQGGSIRGLKMMLKGLTTKS